MKNLQELIYRYYDKVKSPHLTVTGMLQWGGREYYLINSDVERHLNAITPSHFEKWDRSTDGFIMKGEYVEEYVNNEDVPALVWSYDKEGTQIISDAEMEQKLNFLGTENYDKWRSGLECIMNPAYINKTYNNMLRDYYPHPWYPDKEIVAFECIRISVYWTVGEQYDVFEENEGFLIEGDDHETRLWLCEALDFPEFFKPIYKDVDSRS